MRNRTKSITTLLISALGAALLSSCATTWNYSSGPVVPKDKTYSLNIPRNWTYLPTGSDSVIATFDGTSLNSIEVSTWSLKENLPNSKKTYSPEMSAEQLVDFVYAEISLNPANKGAELESAGPTTFGSKEGIHIVYTYTIQNGLKYRANVSGAVYGEKLYLLSYKAPTRHYYDKYDDQLDISLNSIRFL